MPYSGRMALGLLFLTGCAARRFSLVFIRPRTVSPNRPKPSALHNKVRWHACVCEGNPSRRSGS
jgi:hypothetical protein